MQQNDQITVLGARSGAELQRTCIVQNLISMSCLNCGGRLQIGLEVQQFVCAFCGAEWRVARGEGTVALQPLAEQLASINTHASGIRQSSDRIAAELAIPRLEKEIAELEGQLSRQSRRDRELSVPLPLPNLNERLALILKVLGRIVLAGAGIWALLNMIVILSPATPRSYLAIYVCWTVFPFLVGGALAYSSRRRYQAIHTANAEVMRMHADHEAQRQQNDARGQEIRAAMSAKRAELARHKAFLAS